MIRFRIGHRWKREPADPPHDSVAFELDGVNLLVGAVEEPLAEVVPALVEAVAALHAGRERLVQVSLTEAHLEVVLRRAGSEVEVQLASLARPARLLRPPLRVDEEELTAATRSCGRAFLTDLAEVAPGLLPRDHAQQLEQALRQLARPAQEEPEAQRGPVIQRVEPPSSPGFGFALEDSGGLLRGDARGKGPALGSLLCPGEVWLAMPGTPVAWRAVGPPFLTVLELSRQAVELARAVELGEPRYAFEPGGVRPTLTLELTGGQARLGPGAPFPLDAQALVAAMFHLGQALALALSEHARSLAGNPYLVELTQRCREGLSHLRGATLPPEENRAALARAPSDAAASRPLKVPGRLRRLRFERLWEQRKLPEAEQGRLLLGKQGLVYSTPRLACAFKRQTGTLLWRRESGHGVAVSAEGYVLTASARRLCAFSGREEGARWMRDHDGLRLGPLLLRRDGLLLSLSEDRIAIAFAELSGRELWRLAPPRTRRSHLAVQSHRALLGTDSGYVYGLDLMDGQVRYRLSASLPVHGAPVPWGRHFVVLLGRGTHFVLLRAEAHTGETAWTHELALARPSAPLPSGRSLFLAGELDGEGVLLCLDASGRPRWQRPLHLGPGPYALARQPRGVLVTSALGSAARLDAEGQVEWRVGAVGEPLAAALPPVTSRGVVFLAGAHVRAVDAHGGDVLAELQAGAGLVALQADSRLNLYFLDEGGTLSAYRLGSHFAVVGD